MNNPLGCCPKVWPEEIRLYTLKINLVRKRNNIRFVVKLTRKLPGPAFTSMSTASLFVTLGWNQEKTVLGSIESSRSSTSSRNIRPCSPVLWAVTQSQPSPMSLCTKKISPFWKVNSSVSGIFVYGNIATIRFLSLTGSGGGVGCIRRSLFNRSEQWV